MKECSNNCPKLGKVRIDQDTWLCLDCFDVWFQLNREQV